MRCDDCKHAVWYNGEIIECKCEPIYDDGAPSSHKCCNGKFDRKEGAE